MNYPLPRAHQEEIRRVQTLYREAFGVELSLEAAKELLEGVMQFIYLTEIEDALRPLRQEVQ